MRYLSSLLILLILLSAGAAAADTLHNRFGIYGKAGALYPLQDDFISETSDADSAFATGGGIIFGISRSLALELDFTHVPELDVELAGIKAYEADFTDIALGLQYRIAPGNRLVPYLGLGVDFIRGDLEHVDGASYDLEWTVGGHASAGIDFFLTRGVALNLELRGFLAPEGDVERSGNKVGEYDPTSVVGTVGVRLFLPESAFR